MAQIGARLARSSSAATTFAAVALTVPGCKRDAPPALPAALVVVDTDVAVPVAISRLRIDVFSETGVWRHSRDYPMRRRDDWPASFGIAAPDERPTTALVRLRAYSDGASRDYIGERYRGRQAFAPPKDPGLLRDVCNAAPDLAALQLGTMRRGDYSVTEDSCPEAVLGGSTAFQVQVPAPGKYRFAIIEALPAARQSIFLRRACDDTASELACARQSSSDLPPPRFDVDLEAGEYTLMTGAGSHYNRALVTVMWSAVADWVEPRVPLVAPVAPAPAGSGQPRLTTSAGDETPLTEPEPSATIDRLIRLDLRAGEPFDTRVLLEGACLARMSLLAVRADGTVDGDKSRTCVADRDGPIPAALPSPDAPTRASASGTYPPSPPCDPASTDDQVVCVPGGSFVMGSVATDQALYLTADARTLPLRGAAVSRFYMDRYEVTVNRYRQALGLGFDPNAGTSLSPAENEGPLDWTSAAGAVTFSKTPMGRESYPLNRVAWDHAREVCLFYGGDLPSEAQWEYAALVAGRARKATYPWPSDARPTCTTAVLGRLSSDDVCGALGMGLVPVDAPAMAEDRTPLGIVGLGGNANEYARDALANYDGPCWLGASAIDPVCIDDTSPFRIVRGGNSQLFLESARGAGRRSHTTNNGFEYDGFRCVYREPPRRRWVGL